MNNELRVAISSDFFGAFARLPAAQQGKVAKFITNFQKNPTLPGINYEKIQDARDGNMRSVRIDDDYRGIVLKPESGNVYLLLWVDHHDTAYRWARRHRCAINPETGAIQLYEMQDTPDVATVPVSQENSPFVVLKERELKRLGVPDELMAAVYGVYDETGLDNLASTLPVEAYESLFLYMAGESYEEILRSRLSEAEEEKINVEDFATALQRDASRSRFVVVENELELEAMLYAPLEKWRVFLHPSQRRLAEGNKSGPVRVLGGAGTGKTVVAMHRAQWLARYHVKNGQKILFTTFTKNLATDIATNLSAICTPDEMSMIEVTNLDHWVSQYLRKRKFDYSILYNNDGEELWRRSLDLMPVEIGLSESFYRDEWLRVVQPHGIDSLGAYLGVPRLGRGTRLNRIQRAKIWPVFEEYRTLLEQHKKREVDDAYRDVAALLTSSPGSLPYSAIIVDEAQDMGTQAFRMIRRMVSDGENDLFIVGDGHQRIYGQHRVVLGNCGINVRGRSFKLRINYRTTEEIRKVAVSLLEGKSIDDLDGGLDDVKGYRSLLHGAEPRLMHCRNAADHDQKLVSALLEMKQSGESLDKVCIVGRTNGIIDSVEALLHQQGVTSCRLTKDRADSGHSGAVRLATMHRVKGLEFDSIIIVAANKGIVPLEDHLKRAGDAIEMSQLEVEERCLLYVAMTRAKRDVLILSYGEKSPFLEGLFNP